MNKKFLPIVILVLLLIAGGVFWWWQIQETPPEEWEKAKYSKPEDYVVKETAEGKTIENKKVGLSFKISEGWRIEKPPYSAGQIRLYSEDAKEESLVIMERGCRLMPMVTYIKTSIETLENSLKESHKEMDWLSRDEYRIREVDSHKTLENILEDSIKFNIYHIGIYIPTKNFLSRNKLYSFEFTASLNDKERCTQEFEQFLKTVSIE